MKTHDLTKLDQSDATTLRSRIQLYCANLRGLLHTADGKLVSPPTLSAEGDALADIRTLEGHATELETRLGDTAPVFSAPASAQSPATATAAPAKVAATTPAKKLSLDAQVSALLSANGCKSPAELIVKLERERQAALLATLPKKSRP